MQLTCVTCTNDQLRKESKSVSLCFQQVVACQYGLIVVNDTQLLSLDVLPSFLQDIHVQWIRFL
jgi:hypothetical protein